MAVGIARAGTDQCDSWPERAQELRGGRRTAAMVRDLEHIDGSAGGQAIPEKLWVDVLLHVAGQQYPSLAVTDVQYHRDVVDASALIRRTQRHLARSRPEHADRDAVEG